MEAKVVIRHSKQTEQGVTCRCCSLSSLRPSEGAETMYYFTALALSLNELEDAVAPTDSRRRPDQRLMEDGRWEEANAEKQRLEEKQRSVRREREREAASQRTSSQSEEGKSPACVDAFTSSVFLSVFHWANPGIKG